MRADPTFTPLVTDRLTLRRSEPGDAEAISAYRSDPEVHEHQGWDDTGPDHIRDEIVEMAGRPPGAPGGWVQFSVLDATGSVVGDVGVRVVDEEPSVAVVGYTVAPAYQGQGYATEAVRALVGYAFDVLGADVVRAHADEENVASTAVMRKAGLRLVERWDHEEDGQVWHIVRYERRRSPELAVRRRCGRRDARALEPADQRHDPHQIGAGEHEVRGSSRARTARRSRAGARARAARA